MIPSLDSSVALSKASKKKKNMRGKVLCYFLSTEGYLMLLTGMLEISTLFNCKSTYLFGLKSSVGN